MCPSSGPSTDHLQIREPKDQGEGNGGTEVSEAPVNDSDNGEAPDMTPLDQPKIYMADDLTRTRAKLAYLARELKRSKKIADTWVFDCRVMIKNLYNRISQVDSIADLEKYQ